MRFPSECYQIERELRQRMPQLQSFNTRFMKQSHAAKGPDSGGAIPAIPLSPQIRLYHLAPA